MVFIGHLHFDHAGGLCEVPGCELHVQRDELDAARSGADGGVVVDDLAGAGDWRVMEGEYAVCSGVQAIATPGHTAGHMSLFIEPKNGSYPANAIRSGGSHGGSGRVIFATT